MERPSKKSVISALPNVFLLTIDNDAAKSKLTSQFSTLKNPPPTSTLHNAPPLSTLKNKFPALKKAPPSSTLHKLPLLSTSQTTVLEFTTEELSAFVDFLRRDKTKACHPTSTTTATTTTPATGTTTADTATNTETTSLNYRDSFPPLHCQRQYVEFGKVQDFDLDFDCFAFKSNDFDRENRGTRDAIRRAESRATLTIVSAIVSAGDNDQQRALALHRALIDPRTRRIAKSAGFQSDRMESMSFHWNQLKKMVEAGSSNTGKVNSDQSMVVDTILAAIAGDLVRDADDKAILETSCPLSLKTSLLT